MTVSLTTPVASGRDLEICHSDSETAGLYSTGVEWKERGGSMCDSWGCQNAYKNTLNFMLGKQLQYMTEKRQCNVPSICEVVYTFSKQIVQNCL